MTLEILVQVLVNDARV